METAWDNAEKDLRPRSRGKWGAVDKAIDQALGYLRTAKLNASSSAEALLNLLAVIESVDKKE